jgi:dephospho-CoA kinase
VLRIGLTGGIASGKSLVAQMFAELGATLIDTDSIAREVVAPGEPGLAAVVDAFGDEILTPNGELDRAQLRARVFADTGERRRLERLLHPLIRARSLAAMNAAAGPYVIVAVPLLVETNFAELVDRVLVVDCPEPLQLERLMRRDGIGEAEARAMLAAQTGRSARLAAADDVIDNGGTVEATRRQVAALHRRYLTLSGVC